MKKLTILAIILTLAASANAMRLQISVNGQPAPPDTEITIMPSDTLELDIYSPDGYTPGDDVYFSLCVDSSLGSMTGGQIAGAPPGSFINECPVPPCDFCPPGEEGVGGAVVNINSTPWPPGTYFDGIIYHCEALGDAVIRLYTTVDFVNIVVADSVTIHQRGPDCLKSTAPEYADWAAWGKPDCWCCRYQCRGDVDCQMTGPFQIAIPGLNMLRAAINKTDAVLEDIPDGICCDLDHQKTGPFRVAIPDLNIFRVYSSKLPALLPCCDLNGDCILTPGDKYNFWTD